MKNTRIILASLALSAVLYIWSAGTPARAGQTPVDALSSVSMPKSAISRPYIDELPALNDPAQEDVSPQDLWPKMSVPKNTILGTLYSFAAIMPLPSLDLDLSLSVPDLDSDSDYDSESYLCPMRKELPTVSLDFSHADINDVLKALAIQSNVNIVTTPGVTGEVNVSLTHVSLETALDYVAKVNGYHWVKQENAYLVGPPKTIDALLFPAVVASGDVTKGTDFIGFKYSKADQLLVCVKTLLPNLSLSIVSQPETSGASAVNTALSMDSSAQLAVADPQGGVLVASGPTDDIEKAKTLVSNIEKQLSPTAMGIATEVYHIKYALGSNLMSVLHNVLPHLTIMLGPSQEFDSGSQIAFSEKLSLSDRYTLTSTSTQAKSDLTKTGSSSGQGSSDSSSSANASASDRGPTAPKLLVMTGMLDDLKQAKDLLSKIDIKPAQILYEVKVAELSASDETQLGIKWDTTKASTMISEANVGNGLNLGPLTRTSLSDIATVNLAALITNSPSKLLAKPSVAAVDGQRATVFMGNTYYYVSSEGSTSSGSQTITTASIDLGVTLSLTGRVSDDGYITLYLHPEVSDVLYWKDVTGGGQLPQTTSRFADTIIRVKDGETIAIGGLLQENMSETAYKTPFLGSLPLVGGLFRYSDKKLTKTDIVFVIKTSLINDKS